MEVAVLLHIFRVLLGGEVQMATNGFDVRVVMAVWGMLAVGFMTMFLLDTMIMVVMWDEIVRQ